MRGKLPVYLTMRPTFLAFALAALAAVPAAAEAQRVLGPSLDATTLRRGTLRTMILSENILLNGRWNQGTAEPLGAGLSVNLGPEAFTELATIRDLMGTLGVSDVNPSLGSTRVDLRQRLALTRLGFDYGVTDRVMLRVQAPFVRVRAEGQLRLDGSSASAGINPSLNGLPGATNIAAGNRAVVDAYAAAASALTARRDACAASAGAHPECGTITAEAALVNATIARASQFASALTTIYGAQGLGTGQPFVPLAGSTLETSLGAVGDGLRDNFTRWGVTNVTAGTGLPLGAQVPLIAAEMANLISAPLGEGYEAQDIGKSSRQDLGDIDIGVTVKLFDAFAGDSARRAANSFGIRQSLGLTYRLGGGNFDIPDDFIDLGTGSGHDAIALQSITDVIISEKWWATIGLGWARGAAHERVIRVPLLNGVDLIGADRQVPVRITPANMLELRVAPRWNVNDYFGIGAEWRFRTRGEDDVVALGAPGIVPPSGATVNEGYGAMNTPSNSNEHRWAWTLGYSTLAAESRGKAGLPIEIGYTHEQSIASGRGVVPRRWEDRIQIRYYTRFLGR
jgi:hypothetical protein